MTELSIVVAAAENNCIGENGGIPWNIPDDRKHFKRLTTGHTVVMGRKTYESIVKRLGRPLPKRKNVILTRDKTFRASWCYVVHSLEELNIFLQNETDEVFILGGAEIYKLLLPYVTRIYFTLVHAEYEGDAFFPKLNPPEWSMVRRVKVAEKNDRNEKGASCILYKRRGAPAQMTGGTMTDEVFVDVPNARDEQRGVYERIKKDGVCPFCPEHIRTYHTRPILREGEHWFVTENGYPYEGAKLHFLFIHKGHITNLTEMTPEAHGELLAHMKWLIKTYKIVSGAILWRFGDTHATVGSVKHLHAHLIVGAPRSEGAQKLKVSVGYMI